METEPLTGSLPFQAPDAVQAVALVEDHERLVALPLATVLAPTPMLTVGTGAIADTVVDWLALPPAPVQVSVYVVVFMTAAMISEPCSGCAPLQPSDAMQPAVLTVLQFSVVEPPATSVLGVADNCTTGGGAVTVTITLCCVEPPGPLQSSSNSVVSDSVPVDAEPAMPTAPLQPFDAVQAVASWLDQVSIALSPSAIVVGSTARLTIGAGGVVPVPVEVPPGLESALAPP